MMRVLIPALGLLIGNCFCFPLHNVSPVIKSPSELRSWFSDEGEGIIDELDINSAINQEDTFQASSMMDETEEDLLHRSSSFISDENNNSIGNTEWDVYVDQSKSSLERGSRATLDAFLGLAPPQLIQVHPAIFPKGKKGPVVRCIHHSDTEGKVSKVLEISKVDSVDKVFRILTKHMRVNMKRINAAACECLKWKYKGNEYLESGDISSAITAYDNALQSSVAEQEGIVLLGRASAYQKRASIHKQELQELVADLDDSVPETTNLQQLYEVTAQHPAALSNSIFRRLLRDAQNQDKKYQQTKYRHGLYQYALLHATQDSLRATQLLPNYSKTWMKAGEILSELWKIKESSEYYQMATSSDKSLQERKGLKIKERLRVKQDLLDSARAYGWSEDTLRLVLDVAELRLE